MFSINNKASMRLFLFTALIAVALSVQYVPIPHSKLGLTVGNLSSDLHIEAFYDLLCSDSKDADEVIENVMNTIGLGKFHFTYVFVPLPYHLYSFKVHQLYQFILETRGSSAALKYINYMLENQNDYMESKWRNYKIADFEMTLAHTTATLLLNVGETIRALKPGSPYDIKARAQWKYATGSLAVSGTPIFYANGIRIDGAEDWKEEQWINFIVQHS